MTFNKKPDSKYILDETAKSLRISNISYTSSVAGKRLNLTDKKS
jgi:hypothetical protein